MPFLLLFVCIFLQGVNAAFDVLLICNVNVYELSQRLLLRKNPLNVSYSLFIFPPLFCHKLCTPLYEQCHITYIVYVKQYELEITVLLKQAHIIYTHQPQH